MAKHFSERIGTDGQALFNGAVMARHFKVANWEF